MGWGWEWFMQNQGYKVTGVGGEYGAFVWAKEAPKPKPVLPEEVVTPIEEIVEPPKKVKENLAKSRTYGFDGIKNGVDASGPVPIVYGKHLVGGNIVQLQVASMRKLPNTNENRSGEYDGNPVTTRTVLNPSYVLQEVNGYLFMLVALSEGVCRHSDGSLNFIDALYINGQVHTSYPGILTIAMAGLAEQTNNRLRTKYIDQLDLVDFLGDLITTTDYSDILTTTYVTKTLTRTDANVLRVGVVAPKGLYQKMFDGTYKEVVVDVTVQWRKVGGTWATATDSRMARPNNPGGVYVTAETDKNGVTPFTVVQNGSRVAFRVVGNMGKRWADTPSTLRYREATVPGAWVTTGITWSVTRRGTGIVRITDDLNAGSYEIEIGLGSTQYTLHSPTPINSNTITADKEVTIASASDSSPVQQNRTFQIRGRSKTVVRGEIHIDVDEPGQYEVQVKRNDTGSNITDVEDEVQLDYVTEVNVTDIGYPHTAMVAVGIRASEQLSGGVPKITALMYGKEVEVFTVADPPTSTIKWSDSPVWAIYDLLTNKVYGMGKHFTQADVNLASFIDADDYCDDLVADGAGGTEKRCTLNMVIDYQAPVLDVITQILATFRGFIIWSGGQVKLGIDKDPGSVAQTFGEDDIIDGTLSIAYMAERDKPNTVEVTFLDEDNNYEKTVLTLEDRDTITNATPVVKQPFQLVGVTRQSQAHREARYFRDTVKNNDVVITFSAGPRAANVQVGDVIEVTHTLGSFSSTKFRVFEIGENPDDTYYIVAREYNNSVYTEGTIPGNTIRNIEPIENAAPAVEDLTLAEINPLLEDGVVRSDMVVTWQPQRSYSYYEDFDVYVDPLEQPVKVIAGSTTEVVKVESGKGSDFTEGAIILVGLSVGTERVTVTSISTDDLTVTPLLSVAPAAGDIVSIEDAGFSLVGKTKENKFTVENLKVATYRVRVVANSKFGVANVEGSPIAFISVDGVTDRPETVTGLTGSMTDRVILDWDETVHDAELLANGTFGSGVEFWESQAYFTYAAGKGRLTVGGSERTIFYTKDFDGVNTLKFRTVEGDYWKMKGTITINGGETGSLRAKIFDSTDALLSTITISTTSTATKTKTFVAPANSYYVIFYLVAGTAGSYVDFDNVSFKRRGRHFAGYEIRTADSGWGDMSYAARTLESNYETTDIASRSVTYYVRAYDSLGFYSAASASIAVANTIPDLSGLAASEINIEFNTEGTARGYLISFDDVVGGGGAIRFRYYMSRTSGFTPGPSNLVQAIAVETAQTTIPPVKVEANEDLGINWNQEDLYFKLGVSDELTDLLDDEVFSAQKTFDASVALPAAISVNERPNISFDEFTVVRSEQEGEWLTAKEYFRVQIPIGATKLVINVFTDINSGAGYADMRIRIRLGSYSVWVWHRDVNGTDPIAHELRLTFPFSYGGTRQDIIFETYWDSNVVLREGSAGIASGYGSAHWWE